MRAGKMDKKIELQSVENGTSDSGQPIEAWSTFATVRAQRKQSSTTEYLERYGEDEAVSAVFVIRWRAGVTTEHRVLHKEEPLNIVEIKEIGRQKGLELRCREVRA